MKIQEKCPKLSNFFGSWFPDADLEGLEDHEVVANFLRTPNKSEHDMVRTELDNLLTEPGALPFDDIGKEANRYFKTEEECRLWLLMLKHKLDKKH